MGKAIYFSIGSKVEINSADKAIKLTLPFSLSVTRSNDLIGRIRAQKMSPQRLKITLSPARGKKISKGEEIETLRIFARICASLFPSHFFLSYHPRSFFKIPP